MSNDTKTVLLSGVGGQGAILAADILSRVAMSCGQDVKLSEIHGMAQRGGSVVSHVRIGQDIYSPMIPHRGADVLICFEPAEAVRCLPYLKTDGCAIVCPTPIRPVTASLSGGGYTGGEMMEYLEKTVKNLVVVDGTAICEECGSPKVLNVVLLGAAVASGLTGLTMEEMEQAVEKRVPEKFKEMNLKALKLGALAYGRSR